MFISDLCYSYIYTFVYIYIFLFPRDLLMTGGGNGGFNLYKYHYPKSRTAMHKDNVPVGGDVYSLSQYKYVTTYINIYMNINIFPTI